MLRIQPLNNNILRFYLPHVYMFYILRYESCPKKCKIDHVTVHRSKGELSHVRVFKTVIFISTMWLMIKRATLILYADCAEYTLKIVEDHP